jgi:hypothetical protein
MSLLDRLCTFVLCHYTVSQLFTANCVRVSLVSFYMVIGVIESLLNGLGYVRVTTTSDIKLFRSHLSCVEEVSFVCLTYVVNSAVYTLGYGFDYVRWLLRL